MSLSPQSYVHPTAILDSGCVLEDEVKVWHFCHVRNGAHLEKYVSLGRDVYVDIGVRLGRGTRVQNGVSLYNGLHVGQWCFIGPHAIFTNDLRPRAGKKSWDPKPTILGNGMSVGAGAIIRCGIEVGAFAMIGAGAVVTRDVPPFTLAMGLPAVVECKVCACGETRLPLSANGAELVRSCCRASLHPEVIALAEQESKGILGECIPRFSVDPDSTLSSIT